MSKICGNRSHISGPRKPLRSESTGSSRYCLPCRLRMFFRDSLVLCKKKYKLNVTNFLCSERSLTCYFYCILLDVFKILFLIFIWRQISTMTVNAHGIVKCFDVFKNQFMCMCIIKDFKPVDPFSLQKCMERFYTGVIPWICFLLNNCESYLWLLFENASDTYWHPLSQWKINGFSTFLTRFAFSTHSTTWEASSVSLNTQEMIFLEYRSITLVRYTNPSNVQI